MKTGRLLRILGELVDELEAPNNVESDDCDTAVILEPTDLLPVEFQDEDMTDKDAMVPPLQQKHELLKKATGVENEVDKFAGEDEIEQLKQLAAVKPTISADMLPAITDNSDVD